MSFLGLEDNVILFPIVDVVSRSLQISHARTYCCTYACNTPTAVRTYCTADILEIRCCSRVGTVGAYTYILYVRTAPIRVRTACTYCCDARAYIEEPATCCKYVPTAVRTYLLHLPGIRVPSTVRTHLLHILLFLLMHVQTTVHPALSNAISTPLLHKTVLPTVRTYCCTYS